MFTSWKTSVSTVWRMALLLALVFMLAGCKVEVLTGLTEGQTNEMLALLLKRGMDAQKVSAGKAGYTLTVEETQLVQTLQILKENSLPREEFKSLGDVFQGQGMISSSSEEQARMAFALSQELSNTFGRIDGVLTARVHVVLGVNDTVNNIVIEPSASVFLRHTPDSPVVNLLPNIREVAAKAVAGLSYDKVSVMLVPVRETVTVPPVQSTTIALFTNEGFNWLLLIQIALASLFLVSLGAGAFVLFKVLQARKESIEAEKARG